MISDLLTTTTTCSRPKAILNMANFTTAARQFTVALWNDNHGFIVSSELVLVATIGVLAMIVGLSEVSHNINNELEDVGSAFGKLSQRYTVAGSKGHKGSTDGSEFWDVSDFCDSACDIQATGLTSEY